jgi:hypothetical protein
MDLHIVQVDHSLPDGAVVTAHWRALLTDGDLIALSYGTCAFEREDPSGHNFVPFDSLTEEVVIGWVQDKMGEEIRSGLDSQIEASKNPAMATALPWSNTKWTSPTIFTLEEVLQQKRNTAQLSRAAFKLALLAGGYLDAIEAAYPTWPREVQIMWDDSLYFERMHPSLLQLAAAMNYTEEEVDTLFGVTE